MDAGERETQMGETGRGLALYGTEGSMWMEKLAVVSPVGLDAVKSSDAAPRLDDLRGKIVCEIWNGVFKGDITFPIIRRLLKEKHPGLEVIPYTEFPYVPASDNPAQQRELARRIAEMAREKGADALISGNGA
jgi:hypothetical protein